jgi:hypothetical protein
VGRALRTLLQRGIAGALLALAGGCARARPPAGPPSARAAIEALVRAESGDDPTALWRLLGEPVRRTLDEAGFAERFRGARAERLAHAERVTEALARGGLSEQADVVLDRGGRLALALESDRFRLRVAAPSEIAAATPEEALRRLLEMVEARRFDPLLPLLDQPLRDEIDRQLAARVERLRATLDGGRPPAIELQGDRAVLRYDPRFRIELRRLDGQWRVYDLN